ncbi:S41 family peptidase [Flavobacteriales bacterium]|nr:S41 family peptidase [Flavobacteriales bacterium]
MNKLTSLFILIACIASISCNSVKKYNTAISKKHTVAEIHEDIDYTFKKIRKLHPNLHWFITEENLQNKIDRVKNSITAPLTSEEFFFILSPLVSEIRQGHNAVGYPFEKMEKEERKRYKGSKLPFNKLQFESIGGKVIISEIYDSVKTLQYAELLEIGGMTVDELSAKYNNLRSSDGYNTTFYERRVGLFLKSYYRYENPTFDTVTLKLSINDSIFDTTFYRVFKPNPINDSAKDLEIEAELDSLENLPELTKEEKEAKKKEAKEKSRYETIRGYNKTQDIYTRDYKFLEEDSCIAYLKVRGFMNGPYEQLYDEFFAEVDTAQSEAVVLDFRDNLGGRLAEIHYLISYLAQEEFVTILPMEAKTKTPITKALWSGNNKNPLLLLIKTVATPFVFSYEQIRGKKEDGIYYITTGQSKPTEPKPNAFKGKVYILVNANSFSAASVVPSVLQNMGVATVVGEETGGTSNGTVAGIFKPITLPNSKLGVQFGMGMIRTPYLDTPDGFGVIPDVFLLPTLEDRTSGEDTELNWIINDIQSARETKEVEINEDLEDDSKKVDEDTEEPAEKD